MKTTVFEFDEFPSKKIIVQMWISLKKCEKKQEFFQKIAEKKCEFQWKTTERKPQNFIKRSQKKKKTWISTKDWWKKSANFVKWLC